MIQNRSQKEQGFTLIEIIIVIAIFSALMLGLLNLFDWHNKVYLLERADTQATGSARITMNNMTKYIAQASQVLASRTISGTTYTTGATTVVLQLPSFDTSGNLITNTNDYVVYNLSGTTLSQITELGSASSARYAGSKVMSQDVGTLSITYDTVDVTAATKVTINLRTQAVSRGSNMVDTQVTNTIFLRNK